MKRLLITIFFQSILMHAHAQTSVSFQHLGNATFQNNQINPSIIPEGRWFIGLPVLSGIHINANNKFNYDQAFTKQENGTLLDIDKLLGNLQPQNMVTAKASVNLLYIAHRLKAGPLISFTANERVEADFLYSKEMIRYVFKPGNSGFLNEDVKVSRIGLRATHFREFGLGLAAPVNDQLTVGLRGKFLVGFADASTPGNAKATLRSNGEAFQLSASWQNAMLRTSGIDIYRGDVGDLGSHLIFNSNTGFALDLGGTYHLNRYYTITGSLVDIGFINWKENVENKALNDTSFIYNGVSLDDIDNLQQAIEDSLFDKFKPKDNFDPYKTWLPTTAYGSWIYHYSPQTDFYATVGARYIGRQFKMMYGGGVTQKFGKVFTGSISATKLPQQFFNIGAAFAVNGGPVQMYLAVDHVINFNIPKSKAVDFRFGMSFVIPPVGSDGSGGGGGAGGTPRGTIQGSKGYDTNVFLGKKVKTKKREGIYSIIKKQKRRKLKTKQTQRDKSVQKKSLNGYSGRKSVDN